MRVVTAGYEVEYEYEVAGYEAWRKLQNLKTAQSIIIIIIMAIRIVIAKLANLDLVNVLERPS